MIEPKNRIRMLMPISQNELKKSSGLPCCFPWFTSLTNTEHRIKNIENFLDKLPVSMIL